MRTLRDHIHLVAVGGDVVVLDTNSDAYLCIPDGAEHLRPARDRGHLSPTPEADEALAAAGFFAEHQIGPPRIIPTRPALSLAPADRPSPRFRDVWRAALSAADLLLHYRGRNLNQILGYITRFNLGAPQAPAASSDPEVMRLAGVFHRLSPWLPIPRKCLIRSFVLLRFLQRSGRTADWVFGVATWPFVAHCWLQCGDTVLDDHWERLVAYEPIMVVR